MRKQGISNKKAVCVETFDFDVANKYKPFDNLVYGCCIEEDEIQKKVLGSFPEAIKAQSYS